MTEKIEAALHARIREEGLRLTLPRRAICKALAVHGEDFLTASEILDEAKKLVGQIDSSTAYRTLDEFARIGLLHHVHLGSQPGRWHLTLDHDHQHLVCENCGEPTLVPSSDVAPFFDLLVEKHGFSVNAHHFAILGLCKNCREDAAHSHGHRSE